MFKLKTIFLLLLVNLPFIGQSQASFSFQTVVRNTQGKLVANKLIGVRLSIVKGSSDGAVVYLETHQKSTNLNGLLTLEVGGGSVSQGAITAIDWSQPPYFLKTELDVNGGTNYLISGTTEFFSVPYALHSNSVKTLKNGVNSGEMNYWDGTTWVPLNTGSQGQTLTFCDGKPTWTVGGVCPGSISGLSCANVTHAGALTESTLANSVSSVISYSGGNGGPYSSQAIPSSGVFGLTATLQSGTFLNGSGTLTYTISGTPTTSGTATFALSIAGKSCIISRTVASATQQPQGTYGTNISDVDGNSYKTAIIGTQQWMAENLKTTKYSDGTVIPFYSSEAQWSAASAGATCYLNNDLTMVPKYGRLYNWNTISKTKNGNKNLCPTGWHVPTLSEWNVLIDYLGGVSSAGGSMKEKGYVNWASPNSGATNSSLFTGLPGGGRMYDIGTYDYYTGSGYWWTGSETNTYSAWMIGLQNNSTGIIKSENGKTDGFSIRCVKD